MTRRPYLSTWLQRRVAGEGPLSALTVTTEEVGRSTCIHHGHARPCDALLFLCRPLEKWRTLRCPRLWVRARWSCAVIANFSHRHSHARGRVPSG
eukprot:scaffold9860_cov38-Phaeocystis_antarctica.AAC.1